MKQNNDSDIRKFYNYFKFKNPVEIRVFDKIRYPNGKSLTVTNEEDFIKTVNTYQNEEVDVYIGGRDRTGRTDESVISSDFIFFESDEISETEKIIKLLKDNNIEIGLAGISGQGMHVYVPHRPMELEDAKFRKIYSDKVLLGFKNFLLKNNIDVDTNVFNLSRISRVLGSYNYKRDKLSTITIYNKDIDLTLNTAKIKAVLIEENVRKESTETETFKNNKFILEVKKQWVEGNRQQLALALTGYLRKEHRCGKNTIYNIITEICRECNDDDLRERLSAVDSAFEKDESETIGYKGLVENGVFTKDSKKSGLEIFGRWGQVKQFYQSRPFFFDEHKTFWIWNFDKYCYEKKDEITLLNEIRETTGVGIIESKSRTEILNVMKQFGRMKIPEDIKDTWIQFKNKLYDIASDDILESSPRYFVTNPINWEIGESDETPIIDKLFTDWVGEEHKKELYEIVAFCCVPKYFIHRFFFFLGGGANGKSTFDNLITNFVGKHNVTSSSLERITNYSRFETSKFYKKLVIFLSETSVGDLKKSDTLKRASGDEPIPGEFKGKDNFEFYNYGKILIPTNTIPKSVDDSDGFFRRIKIVDFPNQFKKEKNVLISIPNSEYKNLARKCITIAKEIYEKGTFTNDGDFDSRRNRYLERSVTLLENFITDFCDMELEESMPFDLFYMNYINFLREKNKTQVSKALLGRELKSLGWDNKKINIQEKGIYSSKMFILGLKIKENKIEDTPTPAPFEKYESKQKDIENEQRNPKSNQ